MISSIFNTILYKPLFNILILLYQYLAFGDLGLAIILLTIFIRILLYPLTAQSLSAQKKITELQPKIQEIQKKHKNEPGKGGLEILQLYQKEKINPSSGFLPLLLQIPILIALYKVFLDVSSIDPNLLYSFVSNPGFVKPSFFGILNLNQPSIFLAGLASITQFFQSKTLTTETRAQGSDLAQMMQKQGLYFFPVLTFFILLKLPAAIGLYWLATTLFSLVQQKISLRQ